MSHLNSLEINDIENYYRENTENNYREEIQVDERNVLKKVKRFFKIYLREINREGMLRSCRSRLHDVKTGFFENITPVSSQKSLWDWHFFMRWYKIC